MSDIYPQAWPVAEGGDLALVTNELEITKFSPLDLDTSRPYPATPPVKVSPSAVKQYFWLRWNFYSRLILWHPEKPYLRVEIRLPGDGDSRKIYCAHTPGNPTIDGLFERMYNLPGCEGSLDGPEGDETPHTIAPDIHTPGEPQLYHSEELGTIIAKEFGIERDYTFTPSIAPEQLQIHCGPGDYVWDRGDEYHVRIEYYYNAYAAYFPTQPAKYSSTYWPFVPPKVSSIAPSIAILLALLGGVAFLSMGNAPRLPHKRT